MGAIDFRAGLSLHLAFSLTYRNLQIPPCVLNFRDEWSTWTARMVQQLPRSWGEKRLALAACRTRTGGSRHLVVFSSPLCVPVVFCSIHSCNKIF